jgi:hypothetical protein
MYEIFYLTYKKTDNETESYEQAKKVFVQLYAESDIEHSIKTTEAGLKFLKDVITFGLHLRGELFPEREVTVPILEGVDLTGRLDLTIKSKTVTEIYDFKTTSIMGGYQYKTYLHLEQQRSMIDSAEGKLPVFYLIALHCTKSPTTHAPYMMDFKQWEVDLWLRETKSIIKDILNRESLFKEGKSDVNSLFPRYCTECVDGRYGCGYLNICNQGNLGTEDVEGFVYKETGGPKPPTPKYR